MENSLLHRKDSIVMTAIEIIGELGIQGLSTREMARRQGISEGTLFRHFKSKNEIIFAVLEYFSQYDSEIILTTKLKKLKPKEAINYFIQTYASYYESYPEITAIMQAYDVLCYNSQLAEKVKSIIAGRTNFIQEMIEEGQKIEEIPSEVNSTDLAQIIVGTFRAICLNWRLNNYGFSFQERTVDTMTMLLNAFSR